MDLVTKILQGTDYKIIIWVVLPIVVLGVISKKLFQKMVRVIVMTLGLIGCVYAYVNFGMK